jgi:hypothetical protein
MADWEAECGSAIQDLRHMSELLAQLHQFSNFFFVSPCLTGLSPR